MPDQFAKGLEVIRRAAEDAVHELRVDGVAKVVCSSGEADTRSAVLSVSANGVTESRTFSYAEIEDLGEAIDAPAATKVRMLVSQFVR